MNLFTNIGKAVLYQALGLQKNYSEIIESTQEITDYNNVHCSNCKQCALIQSFPSTSPVYSTATNICTTCKYRTTTLQNTYKKVYYNEKNKYGYKPRLKSNAIKLFILLHFYNPNKFGIINNLSLEDLVQYLHCNIKTIINNLDILTMYGYLSYSKKDAHTISVCLNDYESYYLPANKGGRGFIIISLELFTRLIKINNIVSLRIHLRQLAEFDTLSIKTDYSVIYKSFKELKRTLPEYCKPKIIKNSVKNFNDIFNISFTDTSIRFEIHQTFNCKLQKQKCFDNYLNMLNDFIKSFNNTVYNKNSIIISSDDTNYNYFFEDSEEFLFKPLKFKDYELEDLAQLSMQYSFDNVLYALSYVYNKYYIKERTINNLGGLVRTIIMQILNKNFKVA